MKRRALHPPRRRRDPLPGPTARNLSRTATPGSQNGGAFAQVAPELKGQFVNELVVGFNDDVGLDIVVVRSCIHHSLGNIIEDMAPGGSFYIIGNPSSPRLRAW